MRVDVAFFSVESREWEWTSEMANGKWVRGGRGKGMDSALWVMQGGLPGGGGKLASASRRERFRVCSFSASWCLSQELAEERVVELVSSPTSANQQPLFGESAEMRVLESRNEMARVDFVPLRSS